MDFVSEILQGVLMITLFILTILLLAVILTLLTPFALFVHFKDDEEAVPGHSL